MESLDRNQIEGLLGEVELDAYRLALELVPDAASAAALMTDVFAREAPAFPRSKAAADLRMRLARTMRARARLNPISTAAVDIAAASVPSGLHLRLVDLVEEHQHDEPLGRRKRVLAGVGAALLAAMAVGYGGVRWNALATDRPIVLETSLSSSSADVAVQGDLWVRFASPLTGTASISVQPRDGKLQPAPWDGHVVRVSYRGLHLATTYTVTVDADYRSRYGDVGHFTQHWRFRTEGYPALLTVSPGVDATGIFRQGEVAIQFTRRLPVDPQLIITPADAVLEPGEWNARSWTVKYSGLKPLRSYRVELLVDYGVPKSDIRRTWTFTTEQGPPPPGAPVIWIGTASPWSSAALSTDRLEAIDWNGNLVGTTYQAPPSRQSWDGSLLAGQDAVIRGVDGNPLHPTPDYGPLADDSRTVCQLEQEQPAWLVVGPVNGPRRRVVAIDQSGGRNVAVLACSVRTNRALLTESARNTTTALRVLALDSGRVVFQQLYPNGTYISSSSRDCRFVAEETPVFNRQGVPSSWTTSIRRTSDGAVVSRLPGRRVLAFSSDDRRVLTAPTQSSVTNQIQLLDWQTAKVLWRLPGAEGTDGTQVAYAMAEPNGGSIVLAVASQLMTSEVDQLWIVAGDGTARQVLKRAFYAPFFGGS